MLHTLDFTFYDRLTASGLILVEDIEIEGRVTYRYWPGRVAIASGPMCRAADEPEVDIDTIEVFGHDPEACRRPGYQGEYRLLAPSDPLWERIAGWLLGERKIGDLHERARDAVKCRAAE